MPRGPVRHPIQVVDIVVDEARVTRRARLPHESESQPQTYLPRARLVETGDGDRAFVIAVRARVRVPLPDEKVWVASLLLRAKFVSEDPISSEIAQAFARLSGLFIVWPYARTYVKLLAEMSGVVVPPLPLLSRPQ